MYWTCKDGRKIKIKDLTDDHLDNICFMIMRKTNNTYHGKDLRRENKEQYVFYYILDNIENSMSYEELR